MINLSIITPVYHGKKYIAQLSKMVEACAKEASNVARIEWIISNDCPEENITEVDNLCNVDAMILTTDINRGIHGARVRGLEVAKGDFITFWDQDDVFPSSWIRSQLETISDGEAAVCNQLRNGLEYYGSKGEPSLEKSISKDFLLNQKNGFLPGQVLLRKDSIPEVWMRRIMRKNCADDYFLWLALLSNGVSFIVNNKTYCNHIMHGKNESLDLGDAYDSLNEMMSIIEDEHLFSQEDMKALRESRERTLKKQLREIQIVKNKMQILKAILGRYENNTDISTDEIKGESGRIAIYGADLGEHILKKINEEGIDVVCMIDRNATHLNLSVPAVTIDNIPSQVDFVIMTLLEQGKAVTEELYKLYPSIKVIHIKDLLKTTEE